MEISKSLSLLGWPPPTVVTSILGERCFPRLQQHQGLTEKEKDRGQGPCRVIHHIHYGIRLETYSHLVKGNGAYWGEEESPRGALVIEGISMLGFRNVDT